MQIAETSPQAVEQAVEILRAGGVVAHATETCYGLACDLQNLDAVQKLFAIKKRPEDQPVSALFSSIEQAKEYLQWNDEAQKLADAHLPGPLTIILESSGALHVTATETQSQNVGLRLSPHPTAQALAETFGSPIATTSANIHGQPNPYSTGDIMAQMEGQDIVPDIILDDGTLAGDAASTVVDASSEPITVLRQGDIQVR